MEEDEQAYYDRIDRQLSSDSHIQKAAERQRQKRVEDEKKRRMLHGINRGRGAGDQKSGILQSIASVFTFGCGSSSSK